jgi:hypothetical protein
MDSTDSTRPDLPAGLPGADPAASSGPRVRAIVAGELPAATELTDSIDRLMVAQRDLGRRDALLLAARALVRDEPVKVASIINALLVGSSVTEVMAALEDMASGS